MVFPSSQGVTLWEIISRKEPYPELDNVQAASNVMHKNLKPIPPEHCPPKIAQLMTNCVQTNPNDRPDFGSILNDLHAIEDDIRANPFY